MAGPGVFHLDDLENDAENVSDESDDAIEVDEEVMHFRTWLPFPFVVVSNFLQKRKESNVC